jgi:hypothetical protein
MSNAIAIVDGFVQRPALARRWSGTTVATATRWISAFRVRIPRTSHGGLTPPLLFRLRRPSGEIMTIFAMQKRTFTRAAGVSPPWFSKGPRLQGEANSVWRTRTAESRAAGVSPPWYRKTHLQRRVIFVEWLRLPLHNRLPHHGGLMPPALVAVRTFVSEKTIFAMHERRFTRAAGVSPPWV